MDLLAHRRAKKQACSEFFKILYIVNNFLCGKILIASILYAVSLCVMSKYLDDLSNKSSSSFWKKIPFSWYLFLFLIGTGIVLWQLQPQKGPEVNSDLVFLYRFIQKFIWIAASVILAFCFLSTIVSWLIWKKRKAAGDINVQLDRRDGNHIKIHVRSSMKPLGGFLKLRFVFNKGYASPVMLLEPIIDKKADKELTTYLVKTDLPNIAEYDLEEMVFYFTDFLQFFRFPLSVDKQFLVIQAPETKEWQNLQIHPQKTQTETEKTYSNRKAPGDLLHFKQYESNDDIRRIVWPLYAKTGELVVRQPEIHSQYASDALIQVSFFSEIGILEKSNLSLKMLDFYKNIIYTSFKKLKEEDEFAVFLTTDQNSKAPLSSEKEVQDHIANCEWQQTQSLKSIQKKESISLLIVSSLDNADEVAELAQNDSLGMEILFVPLSEAFAKPSKNAWIRWVFTNSKQNQHIWNALQWRTSPLRTKILENEKRLQDILSLRKSSLLAS
ncbi:MAG: hypothetical protein DI598_11370 [Pseudopedobacter saltans]|uniref:Uncharacterized protein n=1 Tax=Pseudopedobacter saltans TaxID=151895 RepID=A0A2W5EUR0_9SPHI|nr:MAG: hypothetical protein DI598_11370 [Pseudopedobacter saltans]